MPRDHFQKKPNKQDRIDQLENNFLRNVQQIYTILSDMDRRMASLARAKIDPAVLAKFILDGDANRVFMDQVNKELDLEMKRQEAAKQKPPE